MGLPREARRLPARPGPGIRSETAPRCVSSGIAARAKESQGTNPFPSIPHSSEEHRTLPFSIEILRRDIDAFPMGTVVGRVQVGENRTKARTKARKRQEGGNHVHVGGDGEGRRETNEARGCRGGAGESTSRVHAAAGGNRRVQQREGRGRLRRRRKEELGAWRIRTRKRCPSDEKTVSGREWRRRHDSMNEIPLVLERKR